MDFSDYCDGHHGITLCVFEVHSQIGEIMKYCHECGCENLDEAKFCRNCGLKFSEFNSEMQNEDTKTEISKIKPKKDEVIVVNKNVNSIMSRLFLKTDKYSGELRLAKSKSISVVVFIVMFLFLIYANAEFSFAIIVAGIIFGLIFAVPTYVIGYVIGIIFDKITH